MNLHMSSLGTLEPEGACVRFMQLGVTFSEVWHNVIFSGTLIWYHPHQHIQYTQGPVDWQTHMNIYLYHLLLCGHNSYLYYIK